MNAHDGAELKQMQELPLDKKIEITKGVIKEWYDSWLKQVYVSFSGGLDSTVLLHICRQMYPEIEAVYIDTGLEYPEIRNFVKQHDNVTIIKPDMNFRDVILKYGYPVISKEQSSYIKEYRRAKSEKFKELRTKGDGSGFGTISKKWMPLIDAPFKISNDCCEVMKKRPIKKFEKETRKRQIVGTRAEESRLRRTSWIRNGCNVVDATKKNPPQSRPLSFWTHQDILQYIKQYDVPYCSVYGDIIEENGKLTTTGVSRTGCMFCMFGVHLEKEPNRFQKLKVSYPTVYEYCFKPVEQGGLGMGQVLDFINVKY